MWLLLVDGDAFVDIALRLDHIVSIGPRRDDENPGTTLHLSTGATCHVAEDMEEVLEIINKAGDFTVGYGGDK